MLEAYDEVKIRISKVVCLNLIKQSVRMSVISMVCSYFSILSITCIFTQVEPFVWILSTKITYTSRFQVPEDILKTSCKRLEDFRLSRDTP